MKATMLLQAQLSVPPGVVGTLPELPTPSQKVWDKFGYERLPIGSILSYRQSSGTYKKTKRYYYVVGHTTRAVPDSLISKLKEVSEPGYILLWTGDMWFPPSMSAAEIARIDQTAIQQNAIRPARLIHDKKVRDYQIIHPAMPGENLRTEFDNPFHEKEIVEDVKSVEKALSPTSNLEEWLCRLAKAQEKQNKLLATQNGYFKQIAEALTQFAANYVESSPHEESDVVIDAPPEDPPSTDEVDTGGEEDGEGSAESTNQPCSKKLAGPEIQNGFIGNPKGMLTDRRETPTL